MLQLFKTACKVLCDTSDNSLRARAIRAGSLRMVSYVGELLFRLISSLILTRLLFPEAYGLVAMASFIPTILSMWSDVGITASVVRYRGDNIPEFLSTAWIIQACRGVVLWILILIAAYVLTLLQHQNVFPVNSIFMNPQLPPVIAVVGITSFFSGIESTKIWLADRNLQFYLVTFMDLTSKFLGLAFMLALAMWSQTVWVLVGGMIVISFVRTILSHLLLDGPSFFIKWNPEFASDIFNTGKWIALSSSFALIPLQGGTFLLGLYFPAGVVGQYSLATQITSVVKSILESSINIFHTIFGETYRTFPEKLKERYHQMRYPIDLTAFFFVGLFWVAGPSIINLLYDPRYADAGWMIQWLAFGILAMPFESIIHAFPVFGKAHIYAYTTIFQGFLLLLFGFVGYTYWNLEGMVAGISIYRVFSLIPMLIMANKEGWSTFRHEISRLYVLFFGMFAGWGVTYFTSWIEGA